MSDEGLSHRAAGRVAGVSKTAIGKAIEAGHLDALHGGKVTAAALDRWMSGRRAPSGNQPAVCRRQVATPPANPEIPGLIASLSVLSEIFVADVLDALSPLLGHEAVKDVCDRLLPRWRVDIAEMLDEESEPPAGFQSWALHPLFSNPVKLDWQNCGI